MGDLPNNFQLSSMIISGFELSSDQIQLSGDVEYLKKKLSTVISYLLDNDMEHLLRILYRIDVDEEKVKGTLSSGKVGELADLLAVLVIDRLQQKIYYRNKYK